MFGWGAPHRIQVSSDYGKTKVCDPGAPSGVHEDVRLIVRQYSDETKFGMIAYPLETSVNHVASVEVFEALSDIKQLAKE